MDEDYTVPKALRRSQRLHERVRRFARNSPKPPLIPSADDDTFESLALDIARYQYDYSAGFARLCGGKKKFESSRDIPALPTDAFRLARVSIHPPDLDAAVFQTSGTTAAPGRHAVRDLATKEELALLQARATLFAERSRGVVVALAPVPRTPSTSSLGHMMELFMKEFDGRRLTPDPSGAAFDGRSEHRWLVGASGVRVEDLARAAQIAVRRSEPLFILATSFALLAALEELDGARLRTPSRTTVMITGGFKGRKTELDEEALRQMAADAFQIAPGNIIGEYGMTELGSQLFEKPGTRRYVAPAWLRVHAVDPITRKPKPLGQAGLAHFIDLANVDSCLSIVTQDLIVVHEDGVELLGRVPRAIPRGCSLPYEGLISGGAA